MGLNDAVKSERCHIGFFGLRNAGKSSVVNKVTGQPISIVSDIKGTTTDPVEKSMELLPLGPVVIIDTPGLDDEGDLGELRKQKGFRTLDKTDIAILVVDGTIGLQKDDKSIITEFNNRSIPYIIAYNKCDLIDEKQELGDNEIYVSAKDDTNIYALKELIGKIIHTNTNNKSLVEDIVNKGDLVVLVTPIDASAPKGRIILPQQQTIRALLDIGASIVVTKETELKNTLEMLRTKPKIVITDSKAFKLVNALTPSDIQLTSFSILFARYKGNLLQSVEGASKLNKLNDGDTVLIAEGCTHHIQCEDIGRIKMPDWISSYTGKKLNFEFTSGGFFPENLDKYSLIVHCGGCMLNEKEMQSRLYKAKAQDKCITNYGITIAQINGILSRALTPFPELQEIVKQL